METWGHQNMFKEVVSQEIRIYEEGGERKQTEAASGVRCQRGQGLTRQTLMYVS